jgi:hypothetical protein
MTAQAAKIVQKRKTVFEPYDLDYFAQKHVIPKKDAMRILHLHRNDRDACDRAAFRMMRNS